MRCDSKQIVRSNFLIISNVIRASKMGLFARIAEFFKLVMKKILIFLVMLFLIFVVTPLVIIIYFPTVLIRKLVSCLSKVMRPDLGKILSSLSSTIAVDYFFHNNQICSIVVLIRCKGAVNINTLKSKLVNEVIGIQKVGSDLKNIELKQYPYKWMGFIFWRWVKNFDISKHVKYYEGYETNTDKQISTAELEEFEHNFTLKQFPEKRSPWEMILFPNVQSEYGEDESVIMIRFHHSIADGFAIIKFLVRDLLDQPRKIVPRQSFTQRNNIFQQFLSHVKFLKMPYEFAECYIEGRDQNDWVIPRSKFSKTWYSKVIDNISMDIIKHVKNAFDVSATTVIFSALTAAMQTAMLKKNGRVPKFINAGVPFPLKGHPDKLRNFVTMAFVKLPVGENDPVMRLKRVEKELHRVQNSTLPTAFFLTAHVMGCMFHWITSFGALNNPLMPTMAAPTVPGPKNRMPFMGQEILDCHSALGPSIKGLGVMFNTLTFYDLFKAKFLVNGKLVDKQTDVDEMAKNMMNEFYLLKGLADNEV